MALTRPIGGDTPAGRSDGEIQADAQRLARLLECSPREAVEKAVRSALSASVEESFGKPSDLVPYLQETARELSLEIDADDLRRNLEAAVSGTVAEEIVQAETEHAERELVRHWVNVLSHAWDLWDRPADGVRLHEDVLLPKLFGESQREADWNAYFSDVHESLVASIAVEEADLYDLSRQYAEQIRDRLPVELPDGLMVRTLHGHVVLSANGRTPR